MTSKAQDTVEEVSDHPVLKRLARGGYVVHGLLHLVIAWIVVQILMGSGGEASSGGALGQIASAPFGQVLLWIGVVGYAGLSLWQFLDAAVGGYSGKPSGWTERGKALAKGVVYAALAWTTWKFASGGGSDSEQQTADFTRTLMQAPFGQTLVYGVGLIVLAVGGHHVWTGFSRRFLDDLRDGATEDLGHAVVVVGVVGYVGKGIALGAVGLLFALAAWTADPEEATGLDGALKTLAGSPGGATALIVIALGFLAYGLYSFARGRYAKI